LRLNAREAGRLLKELLQRHGRDPAFLLEQVRFALREENDPRAATAALLRGLQAGPLRRPVFLSLPPELHPAWFASRHARVLSPAFALSYQLFFRMIDLQAHDAEKSEAAAPRHLLLRLRLAELLMQSNLAPDILQGLVEAQDTLHRLARAPLTDEQRAQAEVYRLQIQGAIARLPRIPAALVVDRSGVRFYHEPQQRFIDHGNASFLKAHPTTLEFGLTDAEKMP
jgi:hypothetical protein